MTSIAAIAVRGCTVLRSEWTGIWVVLRDGEHFAHGETKLAAVNAARRRFDLPPA